MAQNTISGGWWRQVNTPINLLTLMIPGRGRAVAAGVSPLCRRVAVIASNDSWIAQLDMTFLAWSSRDSPSISSARSSSSRTSRVKRTACALRRSSCWRVERFHALKLNQCEIWHPLRLAEYSDLPIGFVITSAARDLLAYGNEEKQIPRAKTGRS